MSAHIGGKGLVDELLQRLRLILFRDGAYDGLAHDVAAAVNHLGGGVGKNVCSELSRLAVGSARYDRFSSGALTLNTVPSM